MVAPDDLARAALVTALRCTCKHQNRSTVVESEAGRTSSVRNRRPHSGTRRFELEVMT